ncbi:hypothetical protein HZA41_03480 [Candidatus Peregrinibacteria bacterium]|nr:hypothetical protein [Candidatus Peregrinibacteria bacterium]
MNQNLKLIIIAILVFFISMSVGMLVTNNFEAQKDIFPHSALQNNLILAHPDTLKEVGHVSEDE